ncbi:glycosyltransferase family 2 protein [Antarcticibacterium arcticum]|uniref:Glycosyltransferase family 2 protein n=1 Tax=Antarcticibacterium arcticum TaxID=2585771 RepID=A0A5B8YMA3_9FLAO|nr:glycosyltransferase family 2 protein [Antarcticibacterium arcticum]QED37763.1 glycosyltransferase family 2 protein [Antarcticibacterium arcticum]
MSNIPLVSIIIPTFNRAHLILETIESILNQSFNNWECIVVDDSSTDGTEELLWEYFQKDKRLQFHKRPENFKKGANSCRNYGFEQSTGEYLIWFDSDDLMTPDHIAVKVDVITNAKKDFVVAQTANFKDGILMKPYKYDQKEYGIKASDFILSKIHWYTYDILLTRLIAQKLRWNEEMKSWQDYNYFCKMLLETENGSYIEKVVTHRRLHSQSIQSNLTRTIKDFNQELLENRLLTFYDIQVSIDTFTRMELVNGMMNLCYEIGKSGRFSMHCGEVSKIVKKEMSLKSSFLFLLSILVVSIFGRGYILLSMAKRK